MLQKGPFIDQAAAVEIESALQTNLATLKDGLYDLLASLVLVIIALLSFVHATTRIMFAVLGLLLWSLALLITFLYWLRAWATSRASNTIHRS